MNTGSVTVLFKSCLLWTKQNPTLLNRWILYCTKMISFNYLEVLSNVVCCNSGRKFYVKITILVYVLTMELCPYAHW